MKVNGRLVLTVPELSEFIEPAGANPVAPHLWLLHRATGQTMVERRADYQNIPEGWILLMTGPDPAWVAQWGGDLQRACDEQLNPFLSEALGVST